MAPDGNETNAPEQLGSYPLKSSTDDTILDANGSGIPTPLNGIHSHRIQHTPTHQIRTLRCFLDLECSDLVKNWGKRGRVEESHWTIGSNESTISHEGRIDSGSSADVHKVSPI